MRPSASGSTERAVSPMAFGFKPAAFARVGSKRVILQETDPCEWAMISYIYTIYIYTYNYTYISCIYADFMWFPGICNRLPIAFLCKMPPNIPMRLLDNAFGAWVLGSDHRSIHVTKIKNCWVASDPATVTTQILPFRYKELCPWNSAGTKLPLNNPHSNLSPGTVSMSMLDGCTSELCSWKWSFDRSSCVAQRSMDSDITLVGQLYPKKHVFVSKKKPPIPQNHEIL